MRFLAGSTFAMKVSFVSPAPGSRRKPWRTRVVLTFDLDFGDILAITRSEAPSVIIFRLRNQTPATVNPRLFRVIAECVEEHASGAIVLVEDEGFRVRPAADPA